MARVLAQGGPGRVELLTGGQPADMVERDAAGVKKTAPDGRGRPGDDHEQSSAYSGTMAGAIPGIPSSRLHRPTLNRPPRDLTTDN